MKNRPTIEIFNHSSQVAHFEFITFSDLSENCEIVVKNYRELAQSSRISIKVNWSDVSRDITRLLLAKDALDHYLLNNGLNPMSILNLEYVPQARADRRFDCTMAHPLKVYANLINSMNFDMVVAVDPHSDVSEGLINNILIVSKEEAIQWEIESIHREMGKDFSICAPDAGSTKDVFKVAQKLEKPFIQAMKVRDVSTGNIIKTEVHLPEEVPEKVLIIDDLCDGGFTFIKLAEALKEKGVKEVGLFVSHGLFSKGKHHLLDNGLDYVYSSNEYNFH